MSLVNPAEASPARQPAAHRRSEREVIAVELVCPSFGRRTRFRRVIPHLSRVAEDVRQTVTLTPREPT
jgi:hypothetical protein